MLVVAALFFVYWLPTVTGERESSINSADFLLTAESGLPEQRPTPEVNLSDLAPGETPTPTSHSHPTSEDDAPTAAEVVPTPTPAPTATPSPICQSDCVQVGVALEDFPGSFDAITNFGQLSGRMPDIVAFFQAWGDDDREFKDWLPRLDELGLDPLITWEPWRRSEFINQSDYTVESIIAGNHDDYIDTWARAAAAYGDTIYLRFAHEMNTPPGKAYWYPWQGNPEQYIAMWRHVHDRFVAAGATNVQWVWSVAWMNDDAQLYYPGDNYVDWVAMTVLNFGAIKDDSTWRTFAELYGLQHSRAVSYGKPVMISELSSSETGGDKGQWIADIGPALHQFPEIRAFVWLNYSESREYTSINWRVDSSPEALVGWRQLMMAPALGDP